jgi:hypothetical protein
MKALQSPDVTVSYLLFSFRLLVPPSVAALGTLVVLDAQLLQTSKLLKKGIDTTFDDAQWVLTMIRRAPKCRDIGGPAVYVSALGR